jgi:predicted CXXCH cytochrome family protein
MDVLLRLVRTGADGAVEYQDTELSADVLSVGSAPDSAVQLLGAAVAAHHATIRPSATEWLIACIGRCKVTVNGKRLASASLKVGDLVEIGGHRLRLIDPPAGFDFGVEIEPDPTVDPSAYERAFRTDLSMTWLNKRRVAWFLVVLVVVATLLIPYFSIPRQHARAPPLPLLPTDQIWNAGPLTPAHQLAAGQRCASCHQELFVRVRDAACRECHHTTADHVQATRLAQTRLGPAQPCADCHREHHAPATGLVVRDNGLCVDCHANSHVSFGPLKVQPVTGFSASAHPGFTVSLLKQGDALDESGRGQWMVRREPVTSAREQSNLKFSHAQHLDPEHVTRLNGGGALGCADCHTLSADGEHFIPITMQRSCAACHELTFDPKAPERQLPHGRPRDAILLIQDYFVRQAVDPTAAAGGFQRRRLPGQEAEGPPCTEAPLVCATRRAQDEIEHQFTTTRGCAECHEVTDLHSADVLERFRITPVRLTRDYFEQVHFSHRMHAVQQDKTGDDACVSCHAVRKSNSSADLFIPDLPKCLECHTEGAVADRVTLQCTSCHSYHPTITIDRPREVVAR